MPALARRAAWTSREAACSRDGRVGGRCRHQDPEGAGSGSGSRTSSPPGPSRRLRGCRGPPLRLRAREPPSRHVQHRRLPPSAGRRRRRLPPRGIHGGSAGCPRAHLHLPVRHVHLHRALGDTAAAPRRLTRSWPTRRPRTSSWRPTRRSCPVSSPRCGRISGTQLARLRSDGVSRVRLLRQQPGFVHLLQLRRRRRSRTALGRVQHRRRHRPGHVAARGGQAGVRPARLVAGPARRPHGPAVQRPEFGNLDGCRFVFVSSRHDTIAPLANIEPYLGPMRRGGRPGQRPRGARHRALLDHRRGPVAGAAVRRDGAVRLGDAAG